MVTGGLSTLTSFLVFNFLAHGLYLTGHPWLESQPIGAFVIANVFGMLVSYRSTTALFFDVEKNLRTRVTALFDLDLNLREFRLLPKTIHFPEGT